MLTLTRLAIFVTLLTLVIFLLKGQAQTSPQTPISSAGRFQIVQGDYIAISAPTAIPEKGVFRIDTSTGKTWRFAIGVNSDGTFYQRWREVSE